MPPVRPFLIGFAVILLILSGCIKKVERQTEMNYGDFFPLNDGDRYFFTGHFKRVTVTSHENNLFTLTYFDTAGTIIKWQDFSRIGDIVYQKSAVANSGNIPARYFQPPLPFLPWSRIAGDTLLASAIEMRLDSVYSHRPIIVECEIMAVEDVETPAGVFADCIKIKRLYRTLINTASANFDQESYWWFAAHVGPVKYVLPNDSGALIRAVIDDVDYRSQ